jgi:hypothetical protein
VRDGEGAAGGGGHGPGCSAGGGGRQRAFGAIHVSAAGLAATGPTSPAPTPTPTPGPTPTACLGERFNGKCLAAVNVAATIATGTDTLLDSYACQKDGVRVDGCIQILVHSATLGRVGYQLLDTACSTGTGLTTSDPSCYHGWKARYRVKYATTYAVSETGTLIDAEAVYEAPTLRGWGKFLTTKWSVLLDGSVYSGQTQTYSWAGYDSAGATLWFDTTGKFLIADSNDSGITTKDLCAGERDVIDAWGQVPSPLAAAACGATIPSGGSLTIDLKPFGVGGSISIKNDFDVCGAGKQTSDRLVHAIAASVYLDCLQNPDKYFPNHHAADGSGSPNASTWVEPVGAQGTDSGGCPTGEAWVTAEWENDTVYCQGEVLVECGTGLSGYCECVPTGQTRDSACFQKGGE